jgi:hypothetical protein
MDNLQLFIHLHLKVALKQKLSEITIKLPNGDDLPWIETFALTTETPSVVQDINNDFEREGVL